MDYYQLLQLEREPFSNAPDPEYFFQSQQHQGCLQKLELALRLKRGLNVILGDVGTGKTTLCRELIRKFASEEHFETHLIMDPAAETSREFLLVIADMLCPESLDRSLSEPEIKERIKQTLFKKGVDQGKTVILIIDEGQKIASANVEILRELLNYETNAHKLLQIVLFAQQEFTDTLEQHANFADRINLLHQLSPMGFSDTCRMIRHRLKLSSSTPKPLNLFTRPALWAIYQASRGYPRRIIHICHQSVLAMIIQNKSRAGWATIRSCKKRMAGVSGRVSKPLQWLLAGTVGAAVAAFVAVVLVAPQKVHLGEQPQFTQVFKIAREPETAPLPAGEQKLPTAQSAAVPPPEAVSPTVAQPPSQADLTLPELPEPIDTLQPAESPAAPPPVAVQAQPDEPDHNVPPALLGSLRVRPGDTIGALVYRVYGAYRNQILAEVLQVNPHITQPDTIEPGDEIFFPALPFPLQQATAENHWVILDEVHDLATARERIGRLTKSIQTPLQLIARWSPADGLAFQVAVRGAFASLDKAEQYLATLPADKAKNAFIVSDWGKNIRFFSEIYAGRR